MTALSGEVSIASVNTNDEAFAMHLQQDDFAAATFKMTFTSTTVKGSPRKATQ